MNIKTLLIAPLTAFLLGMSATVMAVTPSGTNAEPMRAGSSAMPAEAHDGSSPRMGHMSHGGMHERGMMGGGMMHGGMMGMMGGCPMMSAANGPNGKVMMQMHGEMMRAMGDIMIKYADKLEMPASSK